MNALFLRDINPGTLAAMKVYRLDPPYKGRDLVVVSAMPAFGDRPAETAVFALQGEETLGDLLYTLPGSLDHGAALQGLENEVYEARSRNDEAGA